MPTTVTDAAIVLLGFVVLIVGTATALVLRRARGKDLASREIGLYLLPTSVIFVIVALLSVGASGIELYSAVAVAAIAVGLGIYLATRRRQLEMSSQDRTVLMLIGLAVAGLALRVVGQLSR